MVYRRGLATAESIRKLPVISLIHLVLERKYFLDEVYDFVWVKGCLLVSKIARLVDTYVVDLVFDTAAMATARLAAFSGWVLDLHGVDGVVNGIAKTSMDIAGVLRSPQTGRIRNYVLFATGVLTIVVICVLVLRMNSSDAMVALGTVSNP